MEKPVVETSKFISLILRHKPETIGVVLDQEGWLLVDTLLEASAQHGIAITRQELKQVVEQKDKKRFELRDGRIRAYHGHSLKVNLNLTAVEPPTYLFHGTAKAWMDSIGSQGILKMKRQYVHLSADPEKAMKVGKRHGVPAVVRVWAAIMHQEGHKFYLSENGVWLTDTVPPQYLEEMNNYSNGHVS
ncbi:MAG: RNA 2'-phosphotransferase [Symploca sp. SIO2E9]|nr:RNA 2'-phosphotransferase [Symploca sp. SIO2E9]